MIYVIYESDHTKRGISLAATIGAKHGEIGQTKAKAVPGLHTLIFWGHGTESVMCTKAPQQMVSYIAEWKKLNPTLKTVELITCNARHASGNKDSYAGKIVSGLKAGFLSNTRNLEVKALPVTVGGKNNAWSILLWETDSLSWVYITAPGANDAMLMQATNLIKYDEVPEPRSPTGKKLVEYPGNIALKADKVVRAHPQRQWTMNYGMLATLRAQLGVVK